MQCDDPSMREPLRSTAVGKVQTTKLGHDILTYLSPIVFTSNLHPNPRHRQCKSVKPATLFPKTNNQQLVRANGRRTLTMRTKAIGVCGMKEDRKTKIRKQSTRNALFQGLRRFLWRCEAYSRHTRIQKSFCCLVCITQDGECHFVTASPVLLTS